MNWPLDMFLEWQKVAPVHWDADSGTAFVTRYDDVAALLTDRRLGAARVADNLTGVPQHLHSAVQGIERDFIARWPIFTNTPKHTALRRYLLPAFRKPQVLAACHAVSKRMRQNPAPASLSGTLTQARAAFAEGMRVLSGLSRTDLAHAMELAATIMLYLSQPPTDPSIVSAAENASSAITEMARRNIKHGTDPLSSSLRSGLAMGDLDLPDVAGIYAQLFTGAIEPTTAVFGRALEMMCTDRELANTYQHNPEGLLPELIRIATPFHFASRHTLNPVTVDGIDIPADQRVVLVLAAANHDPRQYPHPQQPNADGNAAMHLAFGRGRHACPGSGVASEMIHIALSEVLRSNAFPNAATDPIAWHITAGMRNVAASRTATNRSST